MNQVNTLGLPARQRVIVYIDGFNLYFGIRSSGLGRYLWLDLAAFSCGLLQNGQTLAAIRYFTSRISGPEAKRKRQSAYLDALSTLDAKILSFAYGNYQEAPHQCPRCGETSNVPNEKQTDVNIAVSMLMDAYRDAFDVALLVSADSDLCPAVKAVRTLFPEKRVVSCFPPGRGSKELRSTSSACFTIGRGKLKDAQFPPVLQLPSGFELRKPALWDEEHYQLPH